MITIDNMDSLGVRIPRYIRLNSFTTCINKDGTIIALANPFQTNIVTGEYGSGLIRLFQWSSESDSWSQMGHDITHDISGNTDSLLGYSMSLNDIGNILVVGSPGVDKDNNNTNSGVVKIYTWDNDTQWIQLGQNIYGETLNDKSGTTVSLSHDGSTIAIGIPLTPHTNSNQVRILRWSANDNAWTQVGNGINRDGYNNYKRFGYSISLNNSGSIVAIGVPYTADGYDGKTKVYQYNESTEDWTQLGDTIFGESEDDTYLGDQAGSAVSLSYDGKRIAIGAPNNDAIETNLVGYDPIWINSGHGRVYEFNDETNNWQKLGNDIDSNIASSYFGQAISIDASGTRVAIAGKATGEIVNSHSEISQDKRFTLSQLLEAGYTTTQLINAEYSKLEIYNAQIILSSPTTTLYDHDAILDTTPILSDIIFNQNTPYSATVSATRDNSDDLTFFLSGPDSAYFTLNETDLTAKTVLDFETKATYYITIKSSRFGLFYASADFIITGNITLSSTTIDENAAIGTVIADLSCNDPEGDNITYTVDDTTNFEISGSQLLSKKEFDYETTQSYDITITASDGLHDASANFTITVNNDVETASVLYNANVQGAALKANADVEGITSQQLLAAGYSVEQLHTAFNTTLIDTIRRMKSDAANDDYIFSIKEIEDIITCVYGEDPEDVDYKVSYIGHLNAKGINILQTLHQVGYSITDLINAVDPQLGYLKLLTSYSASDFKDAGYSAINLYHKMYYIDINSGIKIYDRFDATAIRLAGYTADDIKQLQYSAIDLSNAGYTATNLFNARYPPNRLYGKIGDTPYPVYSIQSMCNAGYTGYSIELSSTRSQLETLKNDILSVSPKYSVESLGHMRYFSLYDYANNGYTISDILTSLSNADREQTIRRITQQGIFDISSIVTYPSASTFLQYTYDNGSYYYSVYELKNAGLTVSDFLEYGYNKHSIPLMVDLSSNNYNNAVFTPQELYHGGITLSNILIYAKGHSGIITPTRKKYNNDQSAPTDHNGDFYINDDITDTYRIHHDGQLLYDISGLIDAYPTNQVVHGFTGYTIHDTLAMDVLYSIGYSIYDILDNSGEMFSRNFTIRRILDNSTQYTKNDVITSNPKVSVIDIRLSNLFTIVELSTNYTVTDLKAGGYTLYKIANADVFDASQYYDASYAVSEILIFDYTSKISMATVASAGYSASQLRNAVNATSLLHAGFDASSCRVGGYTIQNLKDATYPDYDILHAGYPIIPLYLNGYTISDISNAGYDISGAFVIETSKQEYFDNSNNSPYSNYSNIVTYLSHLSYSVTEILDSSVNPQYTLAADITPLTLLQPYYSPIDLSNAGYSIDNILRVHYPVDQLYGLGGEYTNISKYKTANYSPSELRDSSFNTSAILGAGYSVELIKGADYSVTDISNSGQYDLSALYGVYPLDEIVDIYGSIDILSTTHWSITQLISNPEFPFTAKLIRDNSYNYYTDDNIISANPKFPIQQIYDASYAVSILTPYYTISDLVDSSYTSQQILNASPKISLTYLYPNGGFTLSEFYDASYSARALQNDTSYNITSILNAGYTYNQLKSTPNNYSIGQLSNYGYYSDTLRTQSGFTVKLLNKKTGLMPQFSAFQLRNSGYTALELFDSDGYSLQQIFDGGYDISQCLTDPSIYNNNYNNLLEVGYTLLQLQPYIHDAKTFRYYNKLLYSIDGTYKYKYANISINRNGNRIAIGEIKSVFTDISGGDGGDGDGPGFTVTDFTKIQVYEINDDGYTSIGTELNADISSGLGATVSFNDDGNILAVGPPSNTEVTDKESTLNLYNSSVRVYSYDASNNIWEQYGDLININESITRVTETNNDISYNLEFLQIREVVLNSQGNRLCVRGIKRPGYFDLSDNWVRDEDTVYAEVRTYQIIDMSIDGKKWMQVGENITIPLAESLGYGFGFSAILDNKNNLQIAIGAYVKNPNEYDISNTSIDVVRVFNYDASNYTSSNDNPIGWNQIGWNQIGSDISNTTIYNEQNFGRSVALSTNNGITRLAITAPHDPIIPYDMYGNALEDEPDSDYGRVYIYNLDTSNDIWTIETTLQGNTQDDRFGHTIDMNNDGTRMVIGNRGYPDSTISVYQRYTDNSWNPVGTDIVGNYGILDSTGNTLAISGRKSATNVTNIYKILERDSTTLYDANYSVSQVAKTKYSDNNVISNQVSINTLFDFYKAIHGVKTLQFLRNNFSESRDSEILTTKPRLGLSEYGTGQYYFAGYSKQNLFDNGWNEEEVYHFPNQYYHR